MYCIRGRGMKYLELISFDPVESIIELKHADNADKAKELVQSYVMSDGMADSLDYGLLRHLQLDEIVNNKGVFIVGNYGTGKSHLMSVVSAVAEDSALLNELKNEKFAGYMEPIAGEFEVLRIELGSVKSSLRDSIVREIEKDLERRGIDYKFPDSSTITNHKGAFEEMMYAFETKYLGKGYLLVIDEFLDYLRARTEREMIADLGFLRELGEFVKTSRLRIICGVQEQLFANPKFNHVAESLSRIQDRFDQIIIGKKDTSYVVSERILSKTPEQKAWIREHLMPFCPLYSEMAEKLDDYVDLYPMHPAYIDMFERVRIAENRHVLETISKTISDLLDEEIPENAPGIISFDSYWEFIKVNYARRSEEDIRKVLDSSGSLEGKVSRAFPKVQYKEMALQIVYALSVHRLTTNGVRVRLGLTAKDLKDDLCLYIENLPEMDSEFLLSMVNVVLKEIIVLMNGEFIEHNEENGQYFIDIDKDIDYDVEIESMADLLSDEGLNEYYYAIAYELLDWKGNRAVPGYEIYEYSLNWDSHNIFRRGYLFFGIPTERSTAQPPRDYYIYILPPYGAMDYQDEKRKDEVFFSLRPDDKFYRNLKLYAAARILQDRTSEQGKKDIYRKEARKYESKIKKWLNNNKETRYDVVYRGVQQQLIQATKGRTRGFNFKDTIDTTASLCLDEYFTERYPGFPVFKTRVTQENNLELIDRVIKHFAGIETEDTRAFLKSFGLIENGRIDVESSKYAMELVRQMEKLPRDGVLNRYDILEEEHRGYGELRDKSFKIGNEYFIAVILALVHTGYANLALKNITITASNMDRLADISGWDVKNFKHLIKPRDAAIAEIKRLFEILDLSPGMVVNDSELKNGLEKLLNSANNIARQALECKGYIKKQPKVWGELLFPEQIEKLYEPKVQAILEEFSNFRNRYNTVAKLKNLNLTMEQLDEIEEGIGYIEIIIENKKFKSEVDSLVNYIASIENYYLPNSLKDDISKAKEEFFDIRDRIRKSKNGEKAVRELETILNPIKAEYIEHYLEMHEKARLGIKGSERKGEIMNSRARQNLRRLTDIVGIFQETQLLRLEEMLANLQVCFKLDNSTLEDRPICHHCNFVLSEGTPTVQGQLEFIEENLEKLLDSWTQMLISSLEDPLIKTNKELLKKDQQELIDRILDERVLPETVDAFFVATFNTLFGGLDKVNIDTWDIVALLQSVGPTTVDELKHRLFTYIDEEVKGKDLDKVRIIVTAKPEKREKIFIAENGDDERGRLQ